MSKNRVRIESAVAQIHELPTLPAVLGRILSTAADPEASALDLGKLISADQSLSAAVLRLVNSAYYGFFRQIRSVTQAIVMLGFLEARNLTLTATAFRSLGVSDSSYDRIQLWRHALATAMAAERCARITRSSVTGCFEAGLLHDIGKVVFDMLFPNEFLMVAKQAHKSACEVSEKERLFFEIDHSEVGGLLAEHWNLPETVVEAIRCHHTPENAVLDPRLSILVCVANHITYQAGFGESSNGCAPGYPKELAESYGFTLAVIEEISRDILHHQEKINDFISSLED